MEYRRLGRTGLKVASLCLGTMQWGWSADEATSGDIMDGYVEAGGNFIDTADVYSTWVEGNDGGVSEEIIGRWMKARGNRHQIVVATKARGRMGPGPNDEGLSRQHIIKAAEDSLRRLQVETIDLYQAHAADKQTPIDETLRAFDDLVRAGKVRYVGASNYVAWELMESLWSAEQHHTVRYDSLQPHYSLVHRPEFERELKAVCEKFQIGVIPYSPLAAGFLTGKYQRDQKTESVRADGVQRRYFNDYGWRVLEAVEAVAKEQESTPTAIALAWQLAQPVITSPIIGANSRAQLKESLAAIELTLTNDQIQRLNHASKREGED
jgi:aryl-alcohol dehydrogenase-like predicted oxidoreductase